MPAKDKNLSTSDATHVETQRNNQRPANDAISALTRKLTGKQIIKDASQFVKTHISRQPPVQRFFSFMPTMLTRVSPFHFKGRHKFSEWPLVRLDSGDANLRLPRQNWQKLPVSIRHLKTPVRSGKVYRDWPAPALIWSFPAAKAKKERR